MNKPFSLSLFALLLAMLASGPVFAQASPRAYAPENLRQLSVQDQARVISLEYSEQSRGRRIPDDQLRFYLDQVNRSSWSFSRIRTDIAQSLAAGNGGYPPQPPASQITCESRDNRYRECPSGFRGRAELVQNLSKARCVEGQNWDSRAGMIWVDKGCRGRFRASLGNGDNGARVVCESHQNAYRECRTPFRGRAVVQRQISSTRCQENHNWGQRPGMIWVRGNCRAEFRDAGNQWGGDSGSGYNITCSSDSNRRRSCAYDARRGRPVLLQQLSNNRCREGYSWGYLGSQLWVDHGCRGRFGPR